VGFDDRFQDIAEPLIVIASLADVERPDGESILNRLKKGLDVAAGRRDACGREQELLAFLEVASAHLGDSPERFVSSKDLVAACQQREDLARIETQKGLANLLKHFDLSPHHNPEKTARGYDLTQEWVEKWQTRYGTRKVS
jgi:hypothetical protein